MLMIGWILSDRYLHIGSAAYGWLLLIYVSVLFCGSYFIQMGFFIKSVNRSNTTEKWVALSFDDGPQNTKTDRILDILEQHQTTAAFFCIGRNIPGNEAILKKILANGHLIGNHSYSHDRFFDLFGSEKMRLDIERMSRLTLEVTGHYPILFRPPYGVTNPNLKKAVLNAGLTSIGWSIRSYDTMIRNETRLLNKILGALKPGAVILLHDTSETTIQILPRLLEEIKAKGYQVIRLDKMLNLIPYA